MTRVFKTLIFFRTTLFRAFTLASNTLDIRSIKRVLKCTGLQERSTNVLWIRNCLILLYMRRALCAWRHFTQKCEVIWWMHTPDDFTFLREVTSWPPSWYCDVKSKIPVGVYMRSIPAKCHTDPIWIDGTLSYFWAGSNRPNNNNKKNKMSSDVQSVNPKSISKVQVFLRNLGVRKLTVNKWCCKWKNTT